MYSRYPNYRFGGIKIPENYSGNAFSEPPLAVSEETEEMENIEKTEDIESVENAVPVSDERVSASLTRQKRHLPFGFNFNIGRLFSGGFGFEEILLITLILLVSQNDTGDDLILLLAILLFVG